MNCPGGIVSSVTTSIDPQSVVRLGLWVHLLVKSDTLGRTSGLPFPLLLISQWRTACYHVKPQVLPDQLHNSSLISLVLVNSRCIRDTSITTMSESKNGLRRCVCERR